MTQSTAAVTALLTNFEAYALTGQKIPEELWQTAADLSSTERSTLLAAMPAWIDHPFSEELSTVICGWNGTSKQRRVLRAALATRLPGNPHHARRLMLWSASPVRLAEHGLPPQTRSEWAAEQQTGRRLIRRVMALLAEVIPAMLTLDESRMLRLTELLLDNLPPGRLNPQELTTVLTLMTQKLDTGTLSADGQNTAVMILCRSIWPRVDHLNEESRARIYLPEPTCQNLLGRRRAHRTATRTPDRPADRAETERTGDPERTSENVPKPRETASGVKCLHSNSPHETSVTTLQAAGERTRYSSPRRTLRHPTLSASRRRRFT